MYDEGEKTLKKETKFGVRATPFQIIKTIGYGFSFPYPVLIFALHGKLWDCSIIYHSAFMPRKLIYNEVAA